MSAADFLPDSGGLAELRAAAAACKGCHLCENATQTVFSKGSVSARVVLVGEQPGDVEDRRGEPFVGPAGKLLDRALEQAGIEAGQVFKTNAVKHFRWRPDERSKRRIHQKPSAGNIRACRPWLAAELRAVHPDLVVALGATAAQAMLGTSFRLTEHRGTVLAADLDGIRFSMLATIHPSAALRAPDRDAALAGLVADLRVAAEFVG